MYDKRDACGTANLLTQPQQRPDILLISAAWPSRALLRAELKEAGFDVVAIEGWPIPGPYVRPELAPRLIIVDLRGMPNPRGLLDRLRHLYPADRVLVVMALGTLAAEELHALGFRVVARPARVGEIVETATALLGRKP